MFSGFELYPRWVPLILFCSLFLASQCAVFTLPLTFLSSGSSRFALLGSNIHQKVSLPVDVRPPETPLCFKLPHERIIYELSSRYKETRNALYGRQVVCGVGKGD